MQIHLVLSGALACFHVWVWVRRGFSIPRYIHIMALVAVLIGFWLVRITPTDAPFRGQGALAETWMILVMPALVYGAFVLLGGADTNQQGD